MLNDTSAPGIAFHSFMANWMVDSVKGTEEPERDATLQELSIAGIVLNGGEYKVSFRRWLG